MLQYWQQFTNCPSQNFMLEPKILASLFKPQKFSKFHKRLRRSHLNRLESRKTQANILQQAPMSSTKHKPTPIWTGTDSLNYSKCSPPRAWPAPFRGARPAHSGPSPRRGSGRCRRLPVHRAPEKRIIFQLVLDQRPIRMCSSELVSPWELAVTTTGFDFCSFDGWCIWVKEVLVEVFDGEGECEGDERGERREPCRELRARFVPCFVAGKTRGEGKIATRQQRSESVKVLVLGF